MIFTITVPSGASDTATVTFEGSDCLISTVFSDPAAKAPVTIPATKSIVINDFIIIGIIGS